MNLVAFRFDDAEVRTVTIHGDPWFVARDVAKALGYSNHGAAVRTHCKRAKSTSIFSGGQTRRANVIPEPDVYRLIVRSSLPSAEAFESWVFEEVLPSIRKTGGYSEEDMTEHGRIVADRRSFDLWQMHNRHIKAKDAEIQALKDQMQELLHALD